MDKRGVDLVEFRTRAFAATFTKTVDTKEPAALRRRIAELEAEFLRAGAATCARARHRAAGRARRGEGPCRAD